MIIDCRIDKAARFERVLVDGVEVNLVFYADTDAGFVRTYDVLGDGMCHATREPVDPELFAQARDRDRETGNFEPWVKPQDGPMSKIVRGVVTLEESPTA